MELGEADRGRRRRAQVGEVIEVRLAENPSTGFRWTEPVYDDGVLEFLGSTYEAPGTRPGAAGSRVVRLRGTRAGESFVRMRNVRPTVPDAPGSTDFDVTIEIEPTTTGP